MATSSHKVSKTASAKAVGKAISRSSGSFKVARSSTGSFSVKRSGAGSTLSQKSGGRKK